MSILGKLFKNTNQADDDTSLQARYNDALNRRDFVAVLPLLRKAIAMEDARAMGAYAALYATGHGVEQDPAEAYRWFLQASNRGDAVSQLCLALCLIGGKGVEQNSLEGAYWLFKAGKAGDMRAVVLLGELVEKDNSLVGPHFSQDEMDALAYALLKSKSRFPSSKSVH